MSGTIVYLDICALKRPFDDARSERIRHEAEAVARIFEKVEAGSFQLVVSPAHRFENDARWFVTTDDRLLKRAHERRDEIRVEVITPDQLIIEEESQP